MSLIEQREKVDALYVNRTRTTDSGEVVFVETGTVSIKIVRPQPARADEIVFEDNGNRVYSSLITWTEYAPQEMEHLSSTSTKARDLLRWNGDDYKIIMIADRYDQAGFYRLTLVKLP